MIGRYQYEWLVTNPDLPESPGTCYSSLVSLIKKRESDCAGVPNVACEYRASTWVKAYIYTAVVRNSFE